MIRSWWTEGFEIRLEDTGDDGAVIVCTILGPAEEFGTIEYDPELGRHIIAWNRDGCLALEQYKRDYWETKFYYAMAEHTRGRS